MHAESCAYSFSPNCYEESNFNLFGISVNTKAHLVYPLKVLKHINGSPPRIATEFLNVCELP